MNQTISPLSWKETHAHTHTPTTVSIFKYFRGV